MEDTRVHRLAFVMTSVALLTMASVVSVPAGPAQATPESESFQTPSRNIGCMYAATPPDPAYLRCDIRSGLWPKPARPATCDLDWGDAVALSPTGETRIVCHGDTVLGDPNTKVLRYGTTWTRGPFTCTSQSNGLTCKNRAGRGFFLSLKVWRRF